MQKTTKLLQEFSIPLILGVLSALIWANINPEGYQHFIHSELLGSLNLHFLVNDIFMVFFFAMAAVEITQSVFPGGDLFPIKRAINPLMATFGGVAGPVVVYLGLNMLIGSPEYTNGWGIPTATDIALAWLLARLVFGAKHPAVKFLLLLAIIDDAIGLMIIAVFYPDPMHAVEPLWLLLTLSGMLVAYIFRRSRVLNYWPYLLVCGVLSWMGLHNAHLHPSLALVFIVPFLPAPKPTQGNLFEVDETERSPLTDLEHEWKVFVDFGLFFFGIVNAGVAFAAVGVPSLLVLLGLLLGKTIGIYIMGSIAQCCGFKLPNHMGKKELMLAGLVGSLGLTVALFVSSVAFTDPIIQGSAKMGALFSVVAFALAALLGKLLGVKRITE